MAKIRRLNIFDIRKIRKMVNYLDAGLPSNLLSGIKFAVFPFDLLHDFLPTNLKFAEEIYVASEKSSVMGIIGIIPDGENKKRWKINRLVLNLNGYDTGKQLIDYVVSKYGAEGVETFLVTIDEYFGEAIALFKNNCGFRGCSQLQVWNMENLQDFKEFQGIPHYLKRISSFDPKVLEEIDKVNLFPQFRMSLAKAPGDFKLGYKDRILNKFEATKVEKFIVNNPDKKFIEGYITLSSYDEKNYQLDMTLSLAYQDYYKEILDYFLAYVANKNSEAKLSVVLRKYYQSSYKLAEVLENTGFKLSKSYQVLVKDYWRPIKAENEQKKAIIVFPEITSPACNFARIKDKDI